MAQAIIPLPSNDDQNAHHAFVYCLTRECIVTGFADTSSFVLMEPKEIGPLSVCPLVAGQWGYLVFGVGAALFFVVLTSLILSDLKR